MICLSGLLPTYYLFESFCKKKQISILCQDEIALNECEMKLAVLHKFYTHSECFQMKYYYYYWDRGYKIVKNSWPFNLRV